MEWFSIVLINECSYIFRKGLEVSYTPEYEVLKKVRGRIDLLETSRLIYLKQNKVSCSYDELSTHIVTNIILKSTFNYLLRSNGISSVTRRKIRDFYIRLGDIPIVDLAKIVSLNIRYTRSNRYYRLAIHICKLIASQLSVHENGKSTVFIDYERDHQALAKLFESFVRNFYSRHLADAKVGATNIHWNFSPIDAASKDLLPLMRTDIVIERSQQVIIADTKFYGNPTDIRSYGSVSREKLNSAHLYQLTSYLSHYRNDANKHVKGLLLYAARDKDFSYGYAWGKHDVMIRTINLNQSWRHIESALLSIVEV